MKNTSIDISIVGDKQLEKKLHRLVTAAQKKIVKGSLRKEAVRSRARIVRNIDREGLVDTGTMRQAFKKAKIVLASQSKNFIRLGPMMPTRAELNIPQDEKGYYPFSLEYGFGVRPATPFVRPAMDENKGESIAAIGSDIGKGIEREAMK